jgi:hypothetical protein
MKFFSIENNENLVSFAKKVGTRNVDNILSANSLNRQHNIGSQLNSMQSMYFNSPIVPTERKIGILNSMTTDSDIFERAALSSEKDWKVLSNTGSFIGMLQLPDSTRIADSVNLLGNNQHIQKAIYDSTIQSLVYNGRVDAAIFNEFSTRRSSRVIDQVEGVGNPMQWFKIPWGAVTLYSSLGGDSIEFPCYPEEYDDGVSTNYDYMPEMLYQYEPWMIYKSTAGRTNDYAFKFHRDMWSGDHRDGKAYQLISFCKANCYPEFQGAAVNTAIVILYIANKPHIRGVMNSVKEHWSGPIGQDGEHLVCELTLNITEISERPLNYQTVRQSRR